MENPKKEAQKVSKRLPINLGLIKTNPTKQGLFKTKTQLIPIKPIQKDLENPKSVNPVEYKVDIQKSLHVLPLRRTNPNWTSSDFNMV